MSPAIRTPPLDTGAEKDVFALEVDAQLSAVADGIGRWQVPPRDPAAGIALTLMAVAGGALVVTIAAVATGGTVPAAGARSLSTSWWAFAATVVAAGMAQTLGGAMQRYRQSLFRTLQSIIDRADAGHSVDLRAEWIRTEQNLVRVLDVILRLQRTLLLAAWVAFVIGLLSLVGFGTSLLPSVT